MTQRIGPIAVLTNANAGKNRSGTYPASRLTEILGDRGFVRESRALTELSAIVAEFKERKVAVIGVNGGDGTWSALLTEVIRQYQDTPLPAFVPLRGGTMNMVGGEVGLTGNPDDLLARTVACWCRAENPIFYRQIKTLRVSYSGLDEPLYGFVWANGLAYGFLREYYRRAPSSFWNAGATVGSLVAGAPLPMERFRRAWRPTRARTVIDGQELDFRRTRIAVASTLCKLVLWFAPFGPDIRRASTGFGYLCNAMSAPEIFLHLWAMSRGQYQGRRHLNQLAQRVQVRTHDGFLLDGDLINPRKEVEVDLRAGPAIRILMPS